jgi:sec-independent protein translocase protein TatA
MSNFKGWEILIVLVLLLLLFGAKRLPDAARGLGRSMRIFKAETKGLRDDDKKADEAADSHQAGAERPAAAPIQPRELPSGLDDRPSPAPEPHRAEHPTER